MKTRRSSDVAFWLLRLVSLGLMGAVAAVVHDIFNPKSPIATWEGGIPSPAEWDAAKLLILLGGFTAATVYFAWYRLAVVTCGWEGVTIEVGAHAGVSVPWSQVESFHKIPFFTPPLFRIAFKRDIDPVYFMMSNGYITVGFWSWDLSGIHKAAKKRLEEEREQA